MVITWHSLKLPKWQNWAQCWDLLQLVTAPLSCILLSKASGKDTSTPRSLSPDFPISGAPDGFCWIPHWAGNPEAPFPKPALLHREGFITGSHLCYTVKVLRQSPKNENKHQTELWKHQRCFWTNYGRFLTISITCCVRKRHTVL